MTHLFSSPWRLGQGSPRLPRRSFLPLWAATAALMMACSGAPKLPTTGPQTAQAVLAKALARPLPSSVQGMSRLEAFVDGKARKADVVLLVERPTRAQFKALTPTLDLVAVMSTDGQRFTSYERGAGQCYVGAACPKNMARLVPIALPPKQLVEAVLGRPPLIAAASSKLSWDAGRKAYKLVRTTADGHWQQSLWVTPTGFRFLASVVRKDGKRVASIAYGELDKLGAKAPPALMRLRLPERKIDMSLRLRDVTIGEDIEDEAFALTCPAGTVAVELPCE